MGRQSGFYWVKLNGEWLIGQFKDSWYFCDPMLDYPGGRDDDDLEKIDERRIENKPCEPEPETEEEKQMKRDFNSLPLKDGN